MFGLVCVLTLPLGLCSSSLYRAERMNIISSICSSFFWLRAVKDIALVPLQTHRHRSVVTKKNISKCVVSPHQRTACCCSWCLSVYILFLRVHKRRFAGGGCSSSEAQCSLRPARGRNQQNRYWSCFLDRTQTQAQTCREPVDLICVVPLYLISSLTALWSFSEFTERWTYKLFIFKNTMW